MCVCVYFLYKNEKRKLTSGVIIKSFLIVMNIIRFFTKKNYFGCSLTALVKNRDFKKNYFLIKSQKKFLT